MNWFGRLLHKRRLERELQKELQFHLERQEADYMQAGLDEKEARRKALIQFGGTEQVREQCREARGTMWLDSAVQDLRLAFRVLRKSPGFTLTALCTLALGIGANAAMFQLLDAVRLRSLPVKNPQDLALIQIEGGNQGFGISGSSNMLSYAVWREIEAHQEGFTGVFAWADAAVRVNTQSGSRPTKSVWVTGETFSTLGVNAIRGRTFDRSDDQPGCGTPGAVISYGYWQSEFGGSDSAIGATLVLDDHPTQILGVTSPRFTGIHVGTNFDIALPLCSLTSYHPSAQAFARRDDSFLTVMGRVKPGWSVGKASAQLSSISPAIFEATEPIGYDATAHRFYRTFRLAAYPAANGISGLRGTYDSALWLLLSITGLVLFIACANLASLMLVRAGAREREIAIRLAIGASRLRLARQLLTEAALIALAGTGIGAGVTRLISKSIILFLGTGGSAPYLDLSFDWRIVAFLAMIAVTTCLVCGLVPAFRGSRTSPGEAIKSGARATTGSRQRASFRQALVVAQIAISLVLVIGALLFVRTFRNLVTLNAGFDRRGVILAQVDFSHLSMPPDRCEPFLESMLMRIRALPQVESASASTHVPLDGSSWTLGVRVAEQNGSSKYTWVSPNYFRTMKIHLLAGRDFNDRDTARSQAVAVVNETFVRQFLNGVDPIGKTVLSRAEPNYPAIQYQIVGVVRDTKYADLREPIPPEAYAPLTQFSASGPGGTIFIRSSASSAGVISAVRAQLAQISPQIRADFTVFDTQVSEGLIRERLMAALSGFFGMMAALLAGIGLYGVISYTVAGRRSEIGIRVALGASRRTIALRTIREAAMLVSLGLLIGTPLAFLAARGASSLLFGLKADDVTTFAAAIFFLLTVALCASWIPAVRAARLDPMNALRYE